MQKTRLATLPYNGQLNEFSVVNVANTLVVLSGGRGEGGVKSAKTFGLIVKEGKWGRKSLPDLNVARAYHSSCSVTSEDQVYVACGDGDGGYLASVEMLRPGAEAWVLIDIPDLTPTIFPILC